MTITIEELKKLLEQKKLTIGSTDVVRKLKQGKLTKVIIANNASKKVIEDIQYNAGFTAIEIEKVPYPNDELGILLKREHPIQAIGILN